MREEEIGFRLSPFVEDGRDSLTPSVLTLTLTHGTHDFVGIQSRKEKKFSTPIAHDLFYAAVR
jgi:hypothetical protein